MLNKFTITLLGLGIVFVLGVGLWSVTSTSRAILATTVDNVLASPAEFTEKKVELSGYIVESDIMPNYSLQSSAPFGSEAGLSSENILSEGIGITGDPAALQQRSTRKARHRRAFLLGRWQAPLCRSSQIAIRACNQAGLPV